MTERETKMKNFTSALWAETLKMRKSRVPFFIWLGFSVAPLIAGLFMIIMKDPEAAKSMGLISSKAQMLAGTADWTTFFSVITQAVAIPVMADIDTGGGNAMNAAWITERLIAMGVGGMNLEDQVFPKRCGHMAGKEVIGADEMAGKIRACAEARDGLDRDFIINARTDAFAALGLDEAIRRCNLYLEAGADLAFIDGIRTKADIEQAVQALKGPLSVNLMDAVTGMKTELVPIPELARLGVGRVSIPVASIMVAHRALTAFFQALKASPTGTLPGETQWVTSFEAFTDFVGLKDYRLLEDRYLPQQRVQEKYHGAAKIVG